MSFCLRNNDNCSDECDNLIPAPPKGFDFDIPTCWKHLSDDDKEKYYSEIQTILEKHNDTHCPICMTGISEIEDIFKLHCCKNFICESCLLENHRKCPLCSITTRKYPQDNFWVDFDMEKLNDLSIERLTNILQEEILKKQVLLDNILELKKMKENCPKELVHDFNNLINSSFTSFMTSIQIQHQIIPSFKKSDGKKEKEPVKYVKKEDSDSECDSCDCSDEGSNSKTIVKIIKKRSSKVKR